MTTFRTIATATALAALCATGAMAESASTTTTPQAGVTQPVGKAQTPDQAGTAMPSKGTNAGTMQAQAKPDATTAPQDRIEEAGIEVANQPVTDGQITIDRAIMPQAGFVALHEVKDNQLSPDAVGWAALKAGETDGVTVKVDGSVKPDTVLVAMLHQDNGKAGSFEFGTKDMNVDGPELIDGQPVAVPFLVLAQAGAQAPAMPGQAAPQGNATN